MDLRDEALYLGIKVDDTVGETILGSNDARRSVISK